MAFFSYPRRTPRLRPGGKVQRTLNEIRIDDFSTSNSVWDFVRATLDAKNAGFEEFEITVPDDETMRFYPNVIAPMSAFCDNLSEQQKVEFKYGKVPGYIRNTSFLNPVPANDLKSYASVLNKVWRFEESEDVFNLVNEYLSEIYKAAVVNDGDVLTGLEWSLNEVMDNVIQHSNTKYGYVMGQIHPTTKHVAFCIVDPGRGILQSFRDSKQYYPKTAQDALTLAIKEGVTRDPDVGQGNGLWGLSSIVKENEGSLFIASAGKSLDVISGEIYEYVYLNKHEGGTVVDFQMDYSVPISLKTVLNGYEPESMKVFMATDQDTGKVYYRLKDQKSGFGTRKSGERIRNELTNLMHQANAPAQIDFQGIGIVSSSFADELVAKLYIEFGPLGFSKNVELISMNPSVESIVSKAIDQRVRQTFSQ